LKNGCLTRQEFLKRLTQKNFEKISIKIWKFKNKAYLCIPVRKTGLERGNEKFIEKTGFIYCTRSKYRENKIYREALILL